MRNSNEAPVQGWFDRRARLWAAAAAIGGIVLLVGTKLVEDPGSGVKDVLLELVESLPVIITSVGLAILFQVTQRQHEDQMALIRDLDVARVHGQRWRAEARLLIDGLGKAMDEQFARWSLTQAERDVALLLLKGLSLKEIATVRATNERTVRSQARALYSKAGLSGRAAQSAFFLEDLLAPAADADRVPLGDADAAERRRTTIQ
ncbi:MAG TPA: LuxR C-terminal-related transcriptional regulator [Rhodanobacteraceae bacterium]|nr:LuxR C-terminal-related transcriptional regulator [Rhodanobacteraceae bacterium]